MRWASSRNCQDTDAGRQGHWLVMWSLLFLPFLFFFLLLERRAFSGSGNLIFFLYSASVTFIPPEGFSHLPQENYFSPQKAQNSEWHTVHLFTGHIYWASGCPGHSTSAGDMAWTGYTPGFRELCPHGKTWSKWLEIAPRGLCGRKVPDVTGLVHVSLICLLL